MASGSIGPLVAGTSAGLMYSPDGTSWTMTQSGLQVYGIVCFKGIWVGVGAKDPIFNTNI